MGYTIYYRNEEKHAKDILQNPKRFQAFKADFLEVMTAFNIPQVASYEDVPEDYDADEYASNASDTCAYVLYDAEVALYGPHESFNFPQYKEHVIKYDADPTFNFTKTAEKSYDGLVKVLYLLAKKHYSGEVSHDGSPEDYLRECEDSYTEADKQAIGDCIQKFGLSAYLPPVEEIEIYPAF